MSILQQLSASKRMSWLEETLAPQVRLRSPKRKYIPFNKFINVHSQSVLQTKTQVNKQIKQNVYSQGILQTSIDVSLSIDRALSTYSIDTSHTSVNKTQQCELSASGLSQSYTYSQFGIVVYLHASGLSQTYSKQSFINYVYLHGKATTQSYIGVKSYGVEVKEIIITRSDLFPAPSWMMETQIPKPRYKRINFVYGKPIYEEASAKCVSYASAHLSIVNKRTAKAISATHNESSIFLNREISGQSVTQTHVISSGFYLATIQELKASGLVQTYNYIYYYQNNPVTVQQLQAHSLSEILAYSTPIYYVNIGSAGCSQTFFFETIKAHNVLLTARTLAQNYFYIGVSENYKKSVPLSCISVDTSHSISALTRHFDMYGTVKSVIHIADSQTNILREEHAQANSESVSNHNNISITRNLSTREEVYCFSSVHENILINLQSTTLLQSEGTGALMLNRVMNVESRTRSNNNTQITRKINQTARTVSLSKSKSGEIITRLLNGVAESVSISRQTAGKVNRLFVSSAISPNLYRGQLYFTKNLYSSFYSESYIFIPEVFTRPIHVQAELNSYADAVNDIMLHKSGTAANITISKAEETIDKPLAANANSQNPFHANPNLVRSINSKQITYSAGKGNPFKKQKLSAQANVQTNILVDEHILRPLAAEAQIETYSDIEITREISLQTEVLAKTFAGNIGTQIHRELSTDTVSQSEADAKQSIHINTHSTAQSESQFAAQSPFKKIRLSTNSVEESYIGTSVIITLYAKIHLSASGILQSNFSTEKNIEKELSGESVTNTELHSNGFNTLINLYTNAVVNASSQSSIDKQVHLTTETVSQTYIGGTDTYFGNKISNIIYAEQIVDQNVENLAPLSEIKQTDNQGQVAVQTVNQNVINVAPKENNQSI